MVPIRGGIYSTKYNCSQPKQLITCPNEATIPNWLNDMTMILVSLQALLSYLSIRGDGPGPLFLFQDGRPLSRPLLTAWLRRILASAGVPGNFSSHSFRIGAATVAARNGIPDHQIQALGRWSSTAYLSYIRTPAETLSKLSKQLTAGATTLP